MEDDRVREFFGWVRRIGARIEVLSADDHDETVALTSHLPQLLSTALAASLRDARRAPDLAGPGLFDMTRLAASPYGVWRDILITNEPAIRGAVDGFLRSLSQLTADFHSSSTETVFQLAESSAERLRALPSA